MKEAFELQPMCVCVCVCMCIYIHTYIHTYIYTYIHNIPEPVGGESVERKGGFPRDGAPTPKRDTPPPASSSHLASDTVSSPISVSFTCFTSTKATSVRGLIPGVRHGLIAHVI